MQLGDLGGARAFHLIGTLTALLEVREDLRDPIRRGSAPPRLDAKHHLEDADELLVQRIGEDGDESVGDDCQWQGLVSQQVGNRELCHQAPIHEIDDGLHVREAVAGSDGFQKRLLGDEVALDEQLPLTPPVPRLLGRAVAGEATWVKVSGLDEQLCEAQP